MLIVLTEFTARIEGSVMRLVRCEHCRAEYVYELHREGIGKTSDIAHLTTTGAVDSAKRTATRRLKKALRTDSDPVPCPRCGLYQRHMFFAARREVRGWAKWAGIVSLCLIPVALMFVALSWASEPYAALVPQFIVSCGLCVAVAAGFFLFRWAIPYDPNREPEETRFAIAKERALTHAGFNSALVTAFEAEQRTSRDKWPVLPIWVRQDDIEAGRQVSVWLPKGSMAAVQLSPEDTDGVILPESRVDASYPGRVQLVLKVYSEVDP